MPSCQNIRPILNWCEDWWIYSLGDFSLQNIGLGLYKMFYDNFLNNLHTVECKQKCILNFKI